MSVCAGDESLILDGDGEEEGDGGALGPALVMGDFIAFAAAARDCKKAAMAA